MFKAMATLHWGLIVVGIALGATIARAETAPGRYLRQGDEWFAGDEAAAITDHILDWQADSGGWPKNVDTTRDRADATIEPNADYATFDNQATTDELRFLARRYNATGDQRCREAFDRGLAYVLGAQYANGGWPQTYPPGKGYKRYITFNDGAMVRLLEFVREVGRDETYAFATDEQRAAARAAFERGIDCILKCQVRRDGRLTVWCAQHDETTLEPRAARTFELASFSGGESVGIVRLLMSIDEPSSEVRAAVDGAAAWLESAKIEGRRIVNRNPAAKTPAERDRVMVDDPTAPALWARFYDLQTNRPLYANRDGVATEDFMELTEALRSHYAWHGDWPRKLLEREYPAWKRRFP